MSRVTIQLAHDVAADMVRERRTKNHEFQNEIHAFLFNKVMEKVPGVIKEAYNRPEFKDYIHVDNSIRLVGRGLDFNYYPLSDFYFPSSRDERMTITLEGSEASKIEKMIAKYSEEYKAINALEKQLRAVLLDLKTFKRVEESFPEAFAFFPKKTENKVYLPANLGTIRKNFQ